ncbi:MAG: hypothetical protein A2351_08720, partial [Omnitrophica bacterium RIFOXYB12_FULL_50_7]
MAYVLVPFLWGFSEAVFFFIVPDVWLTYLVCVNGWKGIWRALLITVAGALLGGLCVYGVGLQWSSEVRQVLERIPGISMPMIESSWKDLAVRGEMAMAVGILKGIPYKIFAAGAGSLQMNIVLFLVASVLVRSIRFLFSVSITLGICKLFFEKKVPNWKAIRVWVLLLFWGA